MILPNGAHGLNEAKIPVTLFLDLSYSKMVSYDFSY